MKNVSDFLVAGDLISPLVPRLNCQFKREMVSGHLSDLSHSPLYSFLLTSSEKDLWEKMNQFSCFAISLFLSKPGLSLLVPETVLALVFALASPGTPPMLTPCRSLPIYWETSCSLLSFLVCLASVYLNSFCEMVTFSVVFDVVPLLLNPHLTVLHWTLGASGSLFC